jgi:hypothetical protein
MRPRLDVGLFVGASSAWWSPGNGATQNRLFRVRDQRRCYVTLPAFSLHAHRRQPLTH